MYFIIYNDFFESNMFVRFDLFLLCVSFIIVVDKSDKLVIVLL